MELISTKTKRPETTTLPLFSQKSISCFNTKTIEKMENDAAYKEHVNMFK